MNETARRLTFFSFLSHLVDFNDLFTKNLRDEAAAEPFIHLLNLMLDLIDGLKFLQ